jgi:hypothetical protein
MTIVEFSNEFDVLYNNITSNQAPGLDEYEKSVFLTQAQEDIVRCYFDPKSNKVQEGFDGSQKRQYDFSSLIKTTELKSVGEIMSIEEYNPNFNSPQLFDNKSIPFLSPNNLFLTINESIIDTKNNERFLVVPITYDEYFRLKAKPYGMPLKRQAWRLITNEANKLARTGYYVDHDNTSLGHTIKVWFTSISSKPVTMVINYSASSQAPTITEEEDKIVITLKPKKGEMVLYWNSYLIPQTTIKTELFKYIMPLDGTKFGSWPNVDLSSNVIISTVGSINSSNQIFEVIGKFKNVANLNYKIRYIEELKPIILTDLTDEDLSIKGYKEAMTSALPSSCHDEILKRAVELAKVAYTGGIQEALIVGNQSSTDIGHVSNQKN